MQQVSVIIPNYNHAPYLEQRISSVLQQSYQDFEIIILDDCSTDRSREVIEQYRNHERVSQIVYNTTNSGTTFKQWEKGIALATGKYIWIAESDDWCEPTFLETLIEGLEKDDQTVFGYCQMFCVDNEGNINWQSTISKLEDYVGYDCFIEKYLLANNSVANASCAVFKKEFFPKISEHYKTFRYCGDWVFWAELSRMGTVYINAKPLDFFRKHNKDVTSSMVGDGSNFIEEFRVMFYLKEKFDIKAFFFDQAFLNKYQYFLFLAPTFNKTIIEQIELLVNNNISNELKSKLKKQIIKQRAAGFVKRFYHSFIK